jgi:hypothetical protein
MLTLRSVPRHSHEFEVKSGMLVFPKPDGWDTEEWEKAELAAMKEVVGLYGKTWHFWQTDLGHEVPLGMLKCLFYETECQSANWALKAIRL